VEELKAAVRKGVYRALVYTLAVELVWALIIIIGRLS
jgi:hypothetical protein